MQNNGSEERDDHVLVFYVHWLLLPLTLKPFNWKNLVADPILANDSSWFLNKGIFFSLNQSGDNNIWNVFQSKAIVPIRLEVHLELFSNLILGIIIRIPYQYTSGNLFLFVTSTYKHTRIVFSKIPFGGRRKSLPTPSMYYENAKRFCHSKIKLLIIQEHYT